MTAADLLQRRQWASAPDQMLAGLRFVGLYRDLIVPDPAVLNAALATITAASPHTRVALNPVPGKRLWSQNGTRPPTVQQIPDDVTAGGNAAILEYIRRRPGAHRPLEVFASQRHIAFDIDHGLGGGQYVVELMLALFDLSHGRPSPWVDGNDVVLALPWALARTFGLHPARARRAWRCATDLRAANAAGHVPAPVAESTPWSPSPAVVIANVDAEAEAAVKDWRRTHAGKSGGAAIWLFIVRQALRAAGLPMTDSVVVAFDCRRYLPKQATTNSNFMIGLEIPFDQDQTLSTLIALLRECKDAGMPLAQLGVASAKAVLRAEARPDTPSTRAVGVPASLMYSEMGHLTMLDDLPWSDADERSLTGLLDPATPDGVTVYCSMVGSARRLSISFHDNVFERCVFDQVVHLLKDPILLLA